MAVMDFLIKNYFSLNSISIITGLKNAIAKNPSLQFDVAASLKSPMNIDRSSIINTTPEGQKFNELYDALAMSPEFQKLFTSIFKDGNRFNVKFEIADHVYEDNNPTKKEVNATTSEDPVTKNIIIKISKQILLAGNIGKSQTRIENAKTILHECVHAYLFVKANNPTIGTDFVKILNTMYPAANEQHNFMFDKMIPTMQKVLSEIRDLVTTQRGRNVLDKEVTMHPTQNPLTSTSWIWSEYYKYLSIKGLEEATSFKKDFPNPSDQLDLFIDYLRHGKNELDR
ncbi:hypothetical protein C8C83_4019 [Flavobacterium sp. 90]|uniref:hypothetical protein n=1 Tax=unclassified Flavobacterium TaxID=196869 RepID=UPI000EB04250|nr:MULTISPECIES: hypothetical protein [unclassified Flavobacterium]RKR04686.1 hypothetical protein C8C82_4350 [Flavobacterium sp. 81]TCK56010.1 hypothetical protein C8C83_4019 [Flavobacterium sp. 90]